GAQRQLLGEGQAGLRRAHEHRTIRIPQCNHAARAIKQLLCRADDNLKDGLPIELDAQVAQQCVQNCEVRLAIQDDYFGGILAMHARVALTLVAGAVSVGVLMTALGCPDVRSPSSGSPDAGTAHPRLVVPPTGVEAPMNLRRIVIAADADPGPLS